MPLPIATHSYFTGALAVGPAVIEQLLGDIPESDPLWDFKMDPNRFTLREMIAHLADWNPIFMERMRRTQLEENPSLPNCDEGRIAEERDYAHSNPEESLKRYSATRNDLILFVEGLEASEWERPAIREGLGPMTMGEQITLVSAHDAYHIRQAIEFRKAWAER